MKSVCHGLPVRLPVMLLGLACLASESVSAAGIPAVPTSFPRGWSSFGRIDCLSTGTSIIVRGGTAVCPAGTKDYEFSFRARGVDEKEPVQIWAAVRVKDRESRYVVGLRGGPEEELSLAHYAPDGKSRFLGWVPLDFHPKPGTWYAVRVAVLGRRIHVYLGDEALPRINIEDPDADWVEGNVGLGGGWLATEFDRPAITPLIGDRRRAFEAVGDRLWAAPPIDKDALRAVQRAAYQPVRIPRLPDLRGKFSLNGNWLFMPDHGLPAHVDPKAIDLDDRGWHVMPVPGFWTPTLGWLHGEGEMPGLTGMAASRGPSDTLVAEEYARLDALTFDWRRTRSGWYRHHIELPGDLRGRHIELVFDAIAKTSEIWVNGAKVAASIGMFRQIRCDISDHVRPGLNVVAVHDIGMPQKRAEDAEQVRAVAVTVQVTNEMLRSLPHGMSDFNSGGIWQPVSLVVTDPVHVDDVFIQPALDGMTAEVEVGNGGPAKATVSLSFTITDEKDASVLFADQRPLAIEIPAGSTAKAKLAASGLGPKLWTPATPNLYRLNIAIASGDGVLDRKSIRFGFRTFTVAGDKLLLNGRPVWLRGGDHFPVTLRPNDAALARHFTQLARDGNVEVTRSHAMPFTEPWFEAADEVGMGVSYEGTWPWLMLEGPLPEPGLLEVWQEEFSTLMHRYRNHPSLLFWTVNNEMKFAMIEKLGPDVLKRKWAVLDDMIKAMRRIDPTRPIVADSAYTRREADAKSKAIREENRFDDGDIDDVHKYYGWYEKSPFHLFDGEFGKSFHTPGRPLISQELSTGYPRNDDWPSRSYEFPRYVPQALVGSYAFEQNDPAIFMTRQAFMTKELVEAIRRTDRTDVNGIMNFAYLTWFTDVWKADKIRPKITYYALKTALQPVLVSAELRGRHFYAGDSFRRRVCLINDDVDGRAMASGELAWRIEVGSETISRGVVAVSPVDYYTNQWIDTTFAAPARLPAPRVNASLVLEWKAGGSTVSTNRYDIVLATREWASPAGNPARKIRLFDPNRVAAATTQGLDLEDITSPDQFTGESPLIIGDVAKLMTIAYGPDKLKAYVKNGGRTLLLQPGADLLKLFPTEVKQYRATEGEIVTMVVPESPIFDGIEPLDTAWFDSNDDRLPRACTGRYQIDRSRTGVTALALQCDLHASIERGQFIDFAGAPLVELRVGKGIVLASELQLANKRLDPIAGRLLANAIKYLGESRMGTGRGAERAEPSSPTRRRCSARSP